MATRKNKDGSITVTGYDAKQFVDALTGSNKIPAFNEKYKVGESVIVTDDDGNEFTDVIKYPASVMGGHTAMAWLEGKGSYLLDRVIRKA